MNGTVLKKRKALQMTDTLKFSIALEFLKKYDLKICLEQMKNVRNKTGLNECFKYLAYGRNILLKGFIQKCQFRYFYIL